MVVEITGSIDTFLLKKPELILPCTLKSGI
jgi:hypothetical protein